MLKCSTKLNDTEFRIKTYHYIYTLYLEADNIYGIMAKSSLRFLNEFSPEDVSSVKHFRIQFICFVLKTPDYC